MEIEKDINDESTDPQKETVVPKCKKCNKILLICKCPDNELKKN